MNNYRQYPNQPCVPLNHVLRSATRSASDCRTEWRRYRFFSPVLLNRPVHWGLIITTGSSIVTLHDGTKINVRIGLVGAAIGRDSAQLPRATSSRDAHLEQQFPLAPRVRVGMASGSPLLTYLRRIRIARLYISGCGPQL